MLPLEPTGTRLLLLIKGIRQTSPIVPAESSGCPLFTPPQGKFPSSSPTSILHPREETLPQLLLTVGMYMVIRSGGSIKIIHWSYGKPENTTPAVKLLNPLKSKMEKYKRILLKTLVNDKVLVILAILTHNWVMSCFCFKWVWLVSTSYCNLLYKAYSEEVQW